MKTLAWMLNLALILLIALDVAGLLPAKAAEVQSAAPGAEQPQAEPEAAEAALAPMHAAAALKLQLAQLLAAAGVPDEAQRQEVAQRLDKLAQESAKLAAALPQSTAKLEARQVELQAYDQLAVEAQREKRQGDVESRARQMRAAAAATKDIAAPGAKAVSEFWLTQADLIEANKDDGDVDARQRQAITRLEKLLPGHAAPAATDSVEPAMLAHVRLALLRLYDQRGMSRQACQLVHTLGAAGDPSVRTTLEQWFAYCPAVGQQFQASLKTTNGKTWSSGDYAGKVILIHFYADWFAPSLEAVAPLKAARQKYAQRGLTLLSVRVDDAPGAPGAANKPAAQLDWPVYQEGAGQVSLRRMFGVRTLPRFVLIDRQGSVAAVGGGLGILDQLEPLLVNPTK